MAQGLFVTLIAGTILAQIAGWIGDNYVGNALGNIAAIAKTLMGAGIGVGIAHALQKTSCWFFPPPSRVLRARLPISFCLLQRRLCLLWERPAIQ